MWELDHKENWVPKNWCFRTVVLENTLESPLDCKEIKPVNPKGNQSWIFIGKTDTDAAILWPPDANSQLIGTALDAGKERGQEEKGATDDEMAGWQHRLSGHKFEPTPGDGEGQGSLALCSSWGSQSPTQLSDWTATTTATSLREQRAGESGLGHLINIPDMSEKIPFCTENKKISFTFFA